MMKQRIFRIDELRAVVEAAYYAEKNGEAYNWSKYCMATPDGMTGYDKYFENLSDRGQSYFEDCMDVALNDVRDDLTILADEHTDSEFAEKLSSSINGWIEAAFDEFLE